VSQASQITCCPAFVGDSIQPVATKTRATAEGGSREGHIYRPLPKEFRHNGFDYRQIYRQGDLAIYRQTWKGSEHSAAFEVIRVKRREAFQVEGRLIEPAEVYPNSEGWDADGFTFTDKDGAFANLRELA